MVQSLEESRSWWTQRVREHFPETWVRFELSSEKYGALIGTLPHDSELCVGRCGDLSCETWRTWDGRVATGLPDLRKLYGGLVYTLHIEPIGTLPELKVGLALLDPS